MQVRSSEALLIVYVFSVGLFAVTQVLMMMMMMMVMMAVTMKST